MSTPIHDNEEWSVYGDPTILRVRATSGGDGWIALTLKTDPDQIQSVGFPGEPLKCQDFADEGTDLAALTLNLKVEEIPHLIGILNELYRRYFAEAVASLEFEDDPDFPRREPLAGGQSLKWPIGPRTEPERDREDWKDRLAMLQDYRFVADKLADDLDKLGLLRPIG